MKRLYIRILRRLVTKNVGRIPVKLKNLVTPEARRVILDLIIYLDPTALKRKKNRPVLIEEDDLRHPVVPLNWIKEIHQFRVSTKDSKILVLVHAFYLDLVPEIINYLENIPENFDLIITNSTDTRLDLKNEDLPELCQKYIELRSINQGRDIAPLVGLVSSNVLEDYELVLKIHTKKSEWRNQHDVFEDTGAEWREAFLRDLLGSAESVARIIKAFRDDSNLGLVTANNQLLGVNFWAENRERTLDLAMRLYIDQHIDELIFPAGSMYWCRPLILSSLAPLKLSVSQFEPESGQTDGTLAHAIERMIGLISIAFDFKQLELGQIRDSQCGLIAKPKIVAYYLPQFYPFPENDIEWGNGFTEWSNVARAKPQFPGHVQPVLPEGLGFYDLRLEENVASQEKLGIDNRIFSFCYYYYNFGHREIMSELLQKRISRSGGLPFSILWVNESWSRAWDGSENHVIQQQTYPKGWESDYFYSILPYLKHADYTVTSNGHALLGIYRPLDVPNLADVISTWRRMAAENGLPGLFILGVRAPKNFGGVNLEFEEYGLDGTQDFAPHGIEWVRDTTLADSKKFHGQIFSLRETFELLGPGLGVVHSSNQFPGVAVGFDNTPRRGSNASLIADSNPFIFRRWLKHSIQIAIENNPNDPFVFINAWNEWAETSMLEPNSKWKNLYLGVIKQLTI
jgi:hypothetical protein